MYKFPSLEDLPQDLQKDARKSIKTQKVFNKNNQKKRKHHRFFPGFYQEEYEIYFNFINEKGFIDRAVEYISVPLVGRALKNEKNNHEIAEEIFWIQQKRLKKYNKINLLVIVYC